MFDNQANVPPAEIRHRIEQLQTRLAAAEIDGALIVQNTDLFYFAGTIQQAHLYVPAAGDPLLMVRKDFSRASAESPINRIIPIKSAKQIPGLLRENGYLRPRRLGLELDVVPVNTYESYRQIFDPTALVDVSTTIRLIRAVKSDYEIGLIARAAEFSDQVAESVKEFLQPGMTEIELAGLVEGRARKLGHQGVIRMRMWGAEMFYGHLMAGAAAAVPSFLASPTGGAAVTPAVAQGPSFRPIQPHEPVLVDYVFAHRGYLSDHTRIFSIGELPEDLLKAHQAMLDLQERIKAHARAGIPSGELYDLAIEWVETRGYPEHFMGAGDQRIRFIGHGIGLEVDEYPFLAKGQSLPLETGMIIALEPKLIIPGKGVVGIENTHQVTPDGLEQFGRYPEEVTVV